MTLMTALLDGLVTAQRKFKFTPLLSSLNLFALSLGFICFLSALSISHYWSSGDDEFDKANRIGVITQNYGEGTGGTGFRPYSGRAIGKYLIEDFPELEAVTRIYAREYSPVRVEAKAVKLHVMRADQNFFSVFDFDFVSGSAPEALSKPDQAILTASSALRLFGNDNPIGQMIDVGDGRSLLVTAVIKDPSSRSHFSSAEDGFGKFDLLYSWSPPADQTDWFMGLSTITYVLFSTDSSAALDALRSNLAGFLDRRMPEDQKAMVNTQIDVIPLKALQSHLLDVAIFEGRSQWLSVESILVVLGSIILIVSCFNYANLATAQTAWRMREIALRKTLGASPSTIFLSFWIEALAFSLGAALLAIGFLFGFSPLLNESFNINLVQGLTTNGTPALTLIATCAGVSTLLCIYPVLTTGLVRPANALRTHANAHGGNILMRSLVTIQYATAAALSTLMIIVHLQGSHMRDAGLTGKASPIIALTDSASMAIGYEALAEDLSKVPAVRAVSQLSYRPWSDYEQFLSITRESDGQSGFDLGFYNQVGADYFDVYDTNVLAGRVFDPERGESNVEDAKKDSGLSEVPIVIDDAMREELGFASASEAIGQPLYFGLELRQATGRNPTLTIIGVIDNQPLVLTASGNRGNVYTTSKTGQGIPLIRLDGNNLEDGLEAVRSAIAARNANALPTIEFMDDAFNEGYKIYDGIHRSISSLSVVALLISVMGLVAIAIFAGLKRRKEIGIRKTIGAKSVEIIALLIKDFTKPVLIGYILGAPIAYLGARAYLSGFTDTISITLTPWVLSFVALIVLALLAVGLIAYRAAGVPPVQVLSEH